MEGDQNQSPIDDENTLSLGAFISTLKVMVLKHIFVHVCYILIVLSRIVERRT